jgi:hypothetical protein
MPMIGRTASWVTVIIPSGTALSNSFQLDPYASLMILIPNGWTNANLGFYAALVDSVTYYAPVLDENGVPCQIEGISTSGAYWYVPQTSDVPGTYAKLWSKSLDNTLGSINQVLDRQITVLMKS